VRSQKLLYLESVRGLAAFAVVVSHLVFAFAHPDQTATPSLGAGAPPDVRTGARLAFWPIGDGRLAVAVFFVLSGVVLSQGYLRSGGAADLGSACVRRYFRLAVPSLVSVLVACALWKAGLMANAGAADVLAGEGFPTTWLTRVNQPDPSWKAAATEALWDIFFGPPDTPPYTLYNSVLWTMRIELYGSLLVFAFLALFGRHPRASAVSVALAILLAAAGQVMWALFAVGVWVALTRHARPEHRYPLGLSAVLVLAAFVLAGFYSYGEPRWVVIPFVNTVYNSIDVAPAAAAVLLVTAVVFCPRLASWLEMRPFVWLGKISFGLYLIHLLVILSAGCSMYVTLRGDYGLTHFPAAAVSSGCVVALSLAGGWVMYHVADRPSIVLGVWVSEKVLGAESPGSSRPAS
jgi:peptidoglycan/LPS O-acetylase OafA/YrhL